MYVYTFNFNVLESLNTYSYLQGQSHLQRDNKGLEEGPSRGSLPGYMPNISVPFNRSVDAYTPNKTSLR